MRRTMRIFVASFGAVIIAVLGVVVAFRVSLAARFLPSDPKSPSVGVRVLSTGDLEVKIPICHGTPVSEVDATLYDRIDKQPENPDWSRGGISSGNGIVTLGGSSGPGSAKGTLPDVRKFRYLYIGYSEGAGGSGAVIDLKAALAAGSTGGRYWTEQGEMTAEQIDSTGNC